MNCIILLLYIIIYLPFLIFGPFRPVLVFLLGINQPLWASVQIFISFGVISLDLVSKAKLPRKHSQAQPSSGSSADPAREYQGRQFCSAEKSMVRIQIAEGDGNGTGVNIMGKSMALGKVWHGVGF